MISNKIIIAIVLLILVFIITLSEEKFEKISKSVILKIIITFFVISTISIISFIYLAKIVLNEPNNIGYLILLTINGVIPFLTVSITFVILDKLANKKESKISKSKSIKK